MGDGFWVAGLNHGAHDSSAVLLYDGELVAAVEQERFSRHKRAIDEPPVDALKWCMDRAGIELSDIAAIALGSDLDALGAWMGLGPEERRAALPLDDPDRLLPIDVFGTAMRPPLIPVRHHLAHAASAFWASGFDEAAVLVIDNRGEDSSTTLARASRGGGIEILESYPVEHSLGLYYRIATQYVGLYSKDGNAGKLMGLASYGRARHDAALHYGSSGPEWLGVPEPTLTGKDLPPERTKQLLEFFRMHSYPHIIGLQEDIFSYVDFAASAQRALEETILSLARDLSARTGMKNVCVAGGVGLNCTANGRLVIEGPFEQVFIQPMAHDAGVALGAAFEVARDLDATRFKPTVMKHAQWGPEEDDDAIAEVLDGHGLAAERLAPIDMARRVSSSIAHGKIVAWHQGRAEVGPRALGGRSLLADPRDRRSHVRLNQIKQREMWRPLAPSVLAREFSRFFVGQPNPFMIVAAEVRSERRAEIPAVVHVDGSARPQAVDPDVQPLFALLLQSFEIETGIPMVVNTSLNTAGVPLANSAQDSVRIFLETEVDELAIGSFLVQKSRAD